MSLKGGGSRLVRGLYVGLWSGERSVNQLSFSTRLLASHVEKDEGEGDVPLARIRILDRHPLNRITQPI
jgi:hypothetical protein